MTDTPLATMELVAFIVCESIEEDANGNPVHLRGLIHEVHASAFPHEMGPCEVCIIARDIRGTHRLSLVLAEESTPPREITQPSYMRPEASDGEELVKLNTAVALDGGITLTRPGHHEIRLLDGERIAARWMIEATLL